jgi:hypothetical protein
MKDGLVEFGGIRGIWDRAAIEKCINLSKAKEYLQYYNNSVEWLNRIDIAPIYSVMKTRLLVMFDSVPLNYHNGI